MASKDGEGTSSTVIINDDPESKARSTAPVPPPPAATAAPKAAATGPFAAVKSMAIARGGWKRGLALLDFLVRLFAIGGAFAATALMATTYEILPFFTEAFQFHTSYQDFDALTFFVIGMATVGGYLVLSLLFSIAGMVRPRLGGLRLLLLVSDTVMLVLTTSCAAAAGAIVYLAHNGNDSANWSAMCEQFNNFCQRSSGAVVSAFVTTVLFIVLITMSARILKTR